VAGELNGTTSLKSETRDVVQVMEDASDELRAASKQKVLAVLTERASNLGAQRTKVQNARVIPLFPNSAGRV
jgi:hypothetical protein